MIPGRAERLPLPTASVDAVVATFVLCSVDDPALALAEIIRVLRPGGTLVFADHVAAEPGTRTRKLQDLVTLTTGPFGGCDQARDTAETIGRAGFEQVRYDQHVVAVPFGVRVPVIVGRATTSDRVAHAVAAPPT